MILAQDMKFNENNSFSGSKVKEVHIDLVAIAIKNGFTIKIDSGKINMGVTGRVPFCVYVKDSVTAMEIGACHMFMNTALESTKNLSIKGFNKSQNFYNYKCADVTRVSAENLDVNSETDKAYKEIATGLYEQTIRKPEINKIMSNRLQTCNK